MASHRYWKLNVLNNGVAGQVQIGELGLFNTGGGPVYHETRLIDAKNGFDAYAVGAPVITPSPAPAHFSTAGDDDYWSIAHDADLSLVSGDWTIELEVYLPTPANQRILCKDDLYTVSYPQYRISTDGSGRPYLTIGTGTGLGANESFQATTAVASNTWTHIAFTLSGSTVSAWMEGVSAMTPGTKTIVMTDGGRPLILGADNNGSGHSCTGTFRNVRITKAAKYTAPFTRPSGALPIGGIDDPFWADVVLAIQGDGVTASANLAASVTASSCATTTAGSTANLFDGDGATSWTGGSAKPESILFNFASAVDIDAMSVLNKNDKFLTYARLDGSDDNITFKPVIWTGQITAGINETSDHLAGGFPGMQVAAKVPMQSVELRGGGSVSVVVPMQQVMLQAGHRFAAQVPMQRLEVTIRRSREAIDITVPMQQVLVRAGHRVDVLVPMQQVEVRGVIPIILRVDVVVPMATAEVRAVGGDSTRVDVAVPMQRVEARFGSSIAAMVPMAKVELTVLAGTLLNVHARVPMQTVEVAISRPDGLRVHIAVPMARTLSPARISVTVPMQQVFVGISLVVEVTYEAYVLSLTPVGEAKVLPVTRYTNWPFDEVIRLGSTYYGIAADGIYELGGDTDHAVPEPVGVAWAWRTALTDFGMTELKTVPSVYLSGRFGRQMEIEWQVGESRDMVYRYTSQRDATAQTVREKFGRGLKARYYALGANGEGEFELDTVDFDVAKLSRRI